MSGLRKAWTGGNPARRGTALLYAVTFSILIAGMCAALLAINTSTARVRVDTQTSQRAFYAAEAGLSDAFMRMDAGLIDRDLPGPYFVGRVDAPVAFGNSSYWVAITQLNSRNYTLASTGNDGRYQDRIELLLSEEPTGFFQYAAFGADGVLLESNSVVDSWDSVIGSYASQVQNGNDYALENGAVGSNANIVMRSNSQIHGDATPGPGGILDDSAPRTYVSGSTDPAEEPFPMPPIVVPSYPSLGSISSRSMVTLGPGDIRYDNVIARGGASVRIVGPANLVVDNFTLMTGASLQFDTTNGPIQLYGTGNFVLQSNSTVTTSSSSAAQVSLLLSGDNVPPGAGNQFELAANSDFFGAIYAPNGRLRLGSNFEIFGAVMCKYLDLSSNGRIHFDEALLYDGWGSSDEFEPSLWRKLPRE